MVKAEDMSSKEVVGSKEIVGSNPGTVYWMDISNTSYYMHKNNENKGSQMGHTKKYLERLIETKEDKFH